MKAWIIWTVRISLEKTLHIVCLIIIFHDIQSEQWRKFDVKGRGVIQQFKQTLLNHILPYPSLPFPLSWELIFVDWNTKIQYKLINSRKDFWIVLAIWRKIMRIFNKSPKIIIQR